MLFRSGSGQGQPREAAELRQLIATWDRLEKRARDLIELDQLADGDPELEQQLAEEKAAIANELRSRELDLLFTDPYANHNAVVTLSVGQGGVEAQDWVEMLMRMYLKWAERKGFETEILETSPGEEAGLKSATFIVRGPRAYGLLRPITDREVPPTMRKALPTDKSADPTVRVPAQGPKGSVAPPGF